ncbi:methyltransferase [Paraglaciecola sp.]|uniref:methyltransferase n=1 Tax=Paraglaciecola sp. TaxID=1920173 RepID=UPI0030F47D4D
MIIEESTTNSLFDKAANIALGRVTETVLSIVSEQALLDKIAAESTTLQQISQLWQLPVMTTRMILQYLCGLGLINKKGDLFQVSDSADEFIAHFQQIIDLANKGSPYINDESLLRQRILAPKPLNWYQIRDSQTEIDHTDLPADFYKGLHDNRIQWGKRLAEQYDFSCHHTLLDIGGATGGWGIGVQQNNPHLLYIIFDMPEVCRQTQQFLQEKATLNAIELAPGNIFQDPLPQSADVMLLANVLHDWNRKDCLAILQKAYAALPENGVLLIKEFFAEHSWNGSCWAGFHALTVLGQGQQSGWQPDYDEMQSLLQDVGFKDISMSHDLVIAKKNFCHS